jgi:hypothetical protein
MGKVLDLTDKRISYNSLDDKDVMKFIVAVRSGFPWKLFLNFADKAPFSMEEWSVFLNMSERTLQRYKTENKTFDPIHSEKILQIALLYNLGVDVFGDN